MANRLAGETSPYLLQHADNPVDWYPWGEEALARARAEDKPILLSIGYAACHWCHVMAHESFEDEETARQMNERFVNIKVDREERPDLDAIYMQAVQAMTGHGGWPMTVFLRPGGEPFYGGTYFPPSDRHGLPSFRRVLSAVADTWRSRRESVDQAAQHLREVLTAGANASDSLGEVDSATLEGAYRTLVRAYDPAHAGFGGAPKFPPSMALDFLLRYAARTGTTPAREMAVQTYRAMARGGIFDQLGGALHRYSVDDRWLVPHFEKMLYDNALFARLGVHLWQLTRDQEVRRTAEATIEWALREMRSPEGGFYSSLDADSEGEEGRFYVWDASEIDELLGGEADIARSYWGVTREGNFEGRNILFVADDLAPTAARLGIEEERVVDAIERARSLLYAERATRVWPGRDEKVLASWNGLMLRAVAEGARVLERPDYREAAIATGWFVAEKLVRDDRVVRTYKNGVVKGPGFLEDHASVALAFLDLYTLTFDRTWFARATRIASSIVEWFLDPASGFFYDTARDHEALITRPRDVTDNAVPSGTSLTAELLVRVAELGGDDRYRDHGTRIIRQTGHLLARYPNAFGHLLGVADMIVHGAVEVAIAGDPDSSPFAELVRCVSARYVPALVLAGGVALAGDSVALLRGRTPGDGIPLAYVCRRYECEAPTADPGHLGKQLDEAGRVL
jgi:hypothetical protein